MDTRTASLIPLLARTPRLLFAVLIGSRASGRSRSNSDWDIAVCWQPGIDPLERIGLTEVLRRALASTLGVSDERVDLVDLRSANLAMRATIAEEGRVLVGDETLAWAHFLTRTWRELEDYYWDRAHAA